MKKECTCFCNPHLETCELVDHGSLYAIDRDKLWDYLREHDDKTLDVILDCLVPLEQSEEDWQKEAYEEQSLHISQPDGSYKETWNEFCECLCHGESTNIQPEQCEHCRPSNSCNQDCKDHHVGGLNGHEWCWNKGDTKPEPDNYPGAINHVESVWKCAGCSKCTNGPATTGDMCVKNNECDCHFQAFPPDEVEEGPYEYKCSQCKTTWATSTPSDLDCPKCSYKTPKCTGCGYSMVMKGTPTKQDWVCEGSCENGDFTAAVKESLVKPKQEYEKVHAEDCYRNKVTHPFPKECGLIRANPKSAACYERPVKPEQGECDRCEICKVPIEKDGVGRNICETCFSKPSATDILANLQIDAAKRDLHKPIETASFWERFDEKFEAVNTFSDYETESLEDIRNNVVDWLKQRLAEKLEELRMDHHVFEYPTDCYICGNRGNLRDHHNELVKEFNDKLAELRKYLQIND